MMGISERFWILQHSVTAFDYSTYRRETAKEMFKLSSSSRYTMEEFDKMVEECWNMGCAQEAEENGVVVFGLKRRKYLKRDFTTAYKQQKVKKRRFVKYLLSALLDHRTICVQDQPQARGFLTVRAKYCKYYSNFCHYSKRINVYKNIRIGQ
ncbi:hypothetical protein CANARDRAFT_131429 [[Candida] arabinofermentans NRRL YB-2248]|uniref:Uncharacterized protein n=1 Tax=[Candida] arabinofermentans NRRL YB-2248 TaxID=983967 RepID=A0A1E4T3C7_9ASCO|nr:hypothetical protein CANARDRAFT_131429 [[Candida] arabinofermentans NRRL YB-2248]